MAGTVGIPVVHGNRRSRRRLYYHLGGLAVGGGTLGLLLGSVRAVVLGPARPWNRAPLAAGLAAALALAYSARQLGFWRVPMPQLKRQVPARWRMRTSRHTAFLYGLGLGLGILTHITSPAIYVAIGWTIVAGEAIIGLIVFASYGVARGVPLAWLALRAANAEESALITAQLMPQQAVIRFIEGVFLAGVGAGLASLVLMTFVSG